MKKETEPIEAQPELIAPHKNEVDDALGSMISQFVSPISNKIYMGYDYNNLK
jgi:hypothetical protein